MLVPTAVVLSALSSSAPAGFQDATVLGPSAPAPPASLLFASASGGGAAVLMTNVPGAPGSLVPGLGGVAFEPGTDTGHFDRIYGHPAGHWILTAFADLPPGEDECLFVDGVLVQREGDPAPWTGGAENCGTLDTRCSVNAHGDFTFATNSSASTLDDYVATRIGGVWGYAAREGDPVPGVAGGILDDVIDSPLLLDDGRVGFAADGIDGVATSADDDVLVLGAALLLRKGVSVPPGQLPGPSGAPGAIENFDLGDFWASGDGAHWLVLGDLDGPTAIDDVVVVDGAVVLQEGVPIPGGGFVEAIDTSGLFGVSMDAAGHWFARGDNDMTNQDWVVRDGVVIASGGAPVVPGAPEVWDDATFSDGFFGHVGNGLGSWVIGGTTDHVDPALDSVLVLNGSTVVCRESDPVDLDGDGIFDDDAYVDAFGDDDLFLTEDLLLYVVATLKDGTGTRIGQALLRIDVDPGVGTPYCDASLNSTGSAATLTALGSAAVQANQLELVARSMPAGVAAVFMAGAERASLPGFSGSLGTLCIGGGVARFVGPGEFGPTDSLGRATLRVDLSAIPRPTGAVAGAVGDTWRFQVWFRDLAPSGATATNLTNAVEVTLE